MRQGCLIVSLLVYLTGCIPVSTSFPVATPTRQMLSAFTSVPLPNPSEIVYPTPTPFPSSTPLVPMPDLNQRYQLIDWTPEKAERLITVLDDFPETLSYVDRGYLGVGSYTAFRFAALARAEAVFQFPDAPSVEEWQWEGAYNRVQSDFGGVGNLYALLIVKGLNQDDTAITDLKEWFENLEPRLSLDVAPTTRPDNYDAGYILSIGSQDNDLLGGFYLWLLKNRSGYVAYPLESRYDFYLVDGEHGLDFLDLTGDSLPEAIIRHLDWQSFKLHSGDLNIFDLSQAPPRKISFSPSPPDIETAILSDLKEENQVVGVSLQIPIDITSGGCLRLGPTWRYRWSDEDFNLIKLQLPESKELMDDTHCADRLVDYLMGLIRENNIPARTELKTVLTAYPFSPNAVKTRDEYRFELGLQLAFQGDVAGAREQMEIIATRSEASTDQWEKLARQFLARYHVTSDIREACLEVGNCYPYLRIDQLVSLVSINDFTDLLILLGQMGVPINTSGVYDFDADQKGEYWLLEYHWPSSYHDFWVLSVSQTGIESEEMIYIHSENEVEDLQISPLEPIKGIPMFQVSIGDAENSGNVFLYWNEGMPVKPIDEIEARQLLDAVSSDLFSGRLPLKETMFKLTELQNAPIVCTYALARQCLAEPYLEYLIGLVNELEGHRDVASQIYLRVWQDYYESPYAIMAMAKLGYYP